MAARGLPFAIAVLLGAGSAAAQDLATPPSTTAPSTAQTFEPLAATAEARFVAARKHLYRNLAWGTASALGGGALWLTADEQEFQRAFGLQTMIWGAIDIAIASGGLLYLSTLDPATSRNKSTKRERFYHDSLLFNMGLDIAYMSIGATLLIAAEADVPSKKRDNWRGHGIAIVIQGAALFTFETFALIGSRRRLHRLLAPVLAVRPLVTPSVVGLQVGWQL